MLTYEQALRRIVRVARPGRPARVELQDAAGLVLAQRITAPLDLPPFDNSAVDGYAVRGAVASSGAPIRLQLAGCSSAGTPYRGTVRAGQAVRIFTGAVVPRGADRIVMQEDVRQQGMDVDVAAWPEAGRHIRRRGEDLRRGTRVLEAGARLRPQAIGLLAALGYRDVRVHPSPAVAILTTGDELQPSGRRLRPGQIYESNGALLAALVQYHGARAIRLGTARDALSSLLAKIRRGLRSDVLLIAGGVSVGERDVVRAALAACGVTEIFWRVNIKPGMPLFFGRRGRTLVFGLPGNPVSVFVTCAEFVVPALHRLLGRAWRDGYTTPAALARALRVSPTRRTHFIRVRCERSANRVRAHPLNGQGSHQLRSLVEADGWIRVTADGGPWSAGTAVAVKQEAASW